MTLVTLIGMHWQTPKLRLLAPQCAHRYQEKDGSFSRFSTHLLWHHFTPTKDRTNSTKEAIIIKKGRGQGAYRNWRTYPVAGGHSGGEKLTVDCWFCSRSLESFSPVLEEGRKRKKRYIDELISRVAYLIKRRGHKAAFVKLLN